MLKLNINKKLIKLPLITLFAFLILAGCGSEEEEFVPFEDIEETEFEKEVKEIILNQVGLQDGDGNDRIEDMKIRDGKEGEETIEGIEQDDSQEDLDTSTKALLRETTIDVTINSTQDEYGQTVDTAHILQELYNNYDLDKVSITWNISDVPDEDAIMLYSLEKRTEADLNWDDVFDELDDVTSSSLGGFTSDIDLFLDWPI